MVKRSGVSGILAVALTALAVTALEARADDFYAGKTLKFLTTSEPGTAPDRRARWVVRHFAKYIPGSPKIVVQGMPGAGGIRMANHFYNIAERDGLTMAMISRDNAYAQLAGLEGVQYDLAKLAWVGAVAHSGQVVFVRSDLPYATLEALKAAEKPIVFAARSVGAANYLALRGLELLGVPMKLVLGYRGNTMNLAFEQGEIDGSALSLSSLQGRGWLEPGGRARLILGFGPVTDPDLPAAASLDVPGEDGELLAVIVEALEQHTDSLALPPGAPAERVAELRAAFDAMVADPAFAADAKKLRLELGPVGGAAYRSIIARFLDKPAAVRKRFKGLMQK